MEVRYEAGFGPCLDAARAGRTIVVDVDRDSPYGDFTRAAARAGVRHIVAVGLPIAQRNIGALNIYASRAKPLRPDFVNEVEIFAAYVAQVVNNLYTYTDAVLEATELRIAMESRAVIEQAKGILMARKGCTADEAFDILRRVPQQRDVKLREVAEELVHSVRQHGEGIDWLARRRIQP